MKYTHCIDCRIEMVGQKAWAKIPAPERLRLSRAKVKRRHHGHGLCTRCHFHRWKAGTMPTERLKVSTELVVEEWQMFADPTRSQNANVQLLAPRMGMTESALEKAILRAKKRGLLGRAA